MTAHTQASVLGKRAGESGIAFILAFACAGALAAAEPPRDLARRVAQRESENESARAHYTYRQTVVVEEIDARGVKAGEYRETRDVVFSPEKGRTEEVLGRPYNSLRRVRLTEEDFRDVREVQPFLFTAGQLWAYQTKYRGEETIDGLLCWVLDVSPRQLFDGQRLFDGTLWIDPSDYSVVRAHGRAVPQIVRSRTESLFPRFTTFREKIDGRHRFPVHTHADDVLPFRSGSQRIRLTIRYLDYRRFAAESSITFEQEKQEKK
jgi:hypothetical protein